MTISYHWLYQYLPEKLDVQELSALLTSVGLEVENVLSVEKVKGGLRGIVIGEVLTCEQHPNADKLKCTTVNVGEEEAKKIVCGAPNVAVGQKVVVALVGAKLYPSTGEAFEIKKAKIRGEESEGMICAEDEIGLGASHAGIIVLPPDAIPGTPAAAYYNLPEGDWAYEIGLTPNRMDAMSHMGVAKDVCAYLSNHRLQQNQPHEVTMRIPAISLPEPKVTRRMQLDIDPSCCARYMGVCIEGIQVGESPEWLKLHLQAVGLRSINSIVDITNYVMLECGQPLHAFDLSMIKGDTVYVKRLADKTSFLTLDEKTIELSSEDALICDEEKPLCIAGVYGGQHSGVTAQTTSLFIESAWFTPDSIRKTSLRHGLRTEAAIRFEKGADISQTRYALERAIQLILEIAGGQVTSEILDHYPDPQQPTQITFSYDRIRSLAGMNYSRAQIKNILLSLCFGFITDNETEATVTVPASKRDISMVADLVEEVMRIDGLDRIPFTGKISYSLPQQKGYQSDWKKLISEKLVAKGFYEIFTNSITNAAYYGNQEGMVKMMNSLSANLDALRPRMLESGLEAIAYNLNRKNDQIKFFEFGRVYAQAGEGFQEDEKLVVYASGNYRAQDYREKSMPVDMYFLKGVVSAICEPLSLDFSADEHRVEIRYRNKNIGWIFQVEEETTKLFGIKPAVWYAEINWDLLKPALQQYKPHFAEIPKFPVVSRDLSMVVPQTVKYQEVVSAIKQAKSKLLQEVGLFDVFRHEKIGTDNISYAVNFSFYDATKTLTDAEVEADMALIQQSLEKRLNAAIRKS
jgi:phenylalanyl-tRNA synthetase beta chain